MKLPSITLPWQRAKHEDEADEGGEMGRVYADYDDDRDDELDEEDTGAEGESEQDDELADLDDETRERVEAYVAKQKQAAVDERTTAWRSEFQTRGFDLTPDGKPLVADPSKVVEFASQFRQVPAPKPEPAAAAQPVDDDPRPDPFTDTEGFIEWTERRAEKKAAALLEAKLAEFAPRIEQQEAWRLSVAERQALDRVRELIPATPFPQLGAPEHAEAFGAEFLRLWNGVPAAQRVNLSDDDLEQLAGATITKVMKRGVQGHDERGRFTSPRSQNAALYQQSHQAHPDGARAPRNPVPSDEERRVMQEYKMTEAELVALSGHTVTIEDYRRAQKAGRGKK